MESVLFHAFNVALPDESIYLCVSGNSTAYDSFYFSIPNIQAIFN